MSDKTFSLIKNMTAGQWVALVKACGGVDAVEDILAGKKLVKLEETIQQTLFDKHGRRIPPKGFESEVVDANREYRLNQPALDYGSRLARLTENLRQGPLMSAAEFEERGNKLLEQISSDKRVANIAKGVHLPICLPKLVGADYGRILEDEFLPAVERAYKAQFPERGFYNYRKGDLAAQVSLASESRYERLTEAMAKGPVVGIYFPTALQGFGINADREQMSALPEGFVLSGALDIATALVGYPDVLARDGKTPVLDCAANVWRAGYSLCCRADDDGLDFARRFLGARAYCSGGLLFLG